MHGVACERYIETISANVLKKTLFEPEEFENAGFNILSKEGFKTWWRYESCDFSARGFLKRKVVV